MMNLETRIGGSWLTALSSTQTNTTDLGPWECYRRRITEKDRCREWWHFLLPTCFSVFLLLQQSSNCPPQISFFFLVIVHPSPVSFPASIQLLHPDGDTIFSELILVMIQRLDTMAVLRSDRLVFQRLLIWIPGPWLERTLESCFCFWLLWSDTEPQQAV